MTGIEKITGRILDDARQEAAAIKAEAEAQAAAIAARHAATAARETEESLRRGTERANERETNLAGAAGLEARKQSLAAKQELLDRAFSQAAALLAKLPEEDYITLLARLAAKASVSGSEELVFDKSAAPALCARVLEAANEALRAEGRKAALKLAAEARNIGPGLLLRDGKVETNASFETLLRLKRGEISAEVAKILFP